MNIESVKTSPAMSVPPPRQAVPDSTAAVVRELPQAKFPDDATQAPPDAKGAQASREDLDRALKAVSEFVKTANNSLEFSIDQDTGIDLVKVIDSSTKEVIRQIPSEEIVAIAKALDNLKGLLIHQKA